MQKIRYKSYSLIPEGPNHAVIFTIKELGLMPNFDKTAQTHTLAIGFECVDSRIQGVRQTIWKRANGESIHEKSNLGKILAATSIAVRPDDEFDPATLVGKNLNILIKHTAKNDRLYADIEGFARLGQSTTVVAPEHKSDEPVPSWLKPQQGMNNLEPLY